MRGSDIRALRKRRGWTQQQLADLISRALNRPLGNASIGDYERERRGVPPAISEFLDQLEIEEAASSLRGDEIFNDNPQPDGREAGEEPQPSVAVGDSAPPPPPGAAQLPLPGGDPALARVCEELWELVSTGVGMVGAATGNEALRRDGRIIYEDKRALGKAWGKLAETNATFRRMLLSATTGGAWLEVAMVSGITFGKCARSHQELALARRQQQAQQAEQEYVPAPEEVIFDGDGSGFAAEAAA